MDESLHSLKDKLCSLGIHNAAPKGSMTSNGTEQDLLLNHFTTNAPRNHHANDRGYKGLSTHLLKHPLPHLTLTHRQIIYFEGISETRDSLLIPHHPALQFFEGCFAPIGGL